jgi:hypothetical protein
VSQVRGQVEQASTGRIAQERQQPARVRVGWRRPDVSVRWRRSAPPGYGETAAGSARALFSLAGAYAWNISHHDFLMHPKPGFPFLGAEPAASRRE